MKKAILMGAMALALGAQAQPFAAWTRYREVTVNTSTVGAVANYPVLVRLSNASLAAGSNVLSDARPNGADLRFTDSTGMTSFSYEIESWSSTGAAIWVKIPSIPAGVKPKIRLYWGKSDAVTASAANDVFGSANDFVGVWHLGNAAGVAPRPNAVAGAPAATPANDGGGTFGGAGYSAPAGVIGNADVLRGDGTRQAPVATSDYLDIGSPAGVSGANFNGTNTFTGYSDFSTGFSYSTWVQAATPFGSYTYLLELANTNGANGNIQIFRPATDARLRYEHANPGTNAGNQKTTPEGSLVENVWQHYAVSVGTGATPSVSLYVNGVRVDDNTAAATALQNTLRTNAWIGKSNYNGDVYWAGAFDESRISRVSRDSNWVKLDYWTQRPESSVVALGATRGAGARALIYASKNPVYKRVTAIAPNEPLTTSAGTGWAYTGTLPAGLTFNTTTGIISGTPTVVGGPAQIIVTATVSSATATDTVNITVIPGDVPGTPPAPTAVLGPLNSGTDTVKWTAPTVTGSSAITSYKVTAVQDTAKSCTWTTGSLFCVVTGLGSTGYSFQVRAINSEGASPRSPASNVVTAPTAPATPAAISAINNKNGSATVYWTAPNNGGSPITGYKVVLVSDTTKSCSWTTGELNCTITGLTGVQASFQVRAINAVGSSAYSTASTPVGVTAISGGFVIRMSGASKPFTFVLPQSEVADEMTMNISDVWGRTVWSKTVVPAKHGRELSWNGTNAAGRRVGAGMYIVKLSVVTAGKTVEMAEKAVSLKP